MLDVFHADREFHNDAKELFFKMDERIFFGYYTESVLTTTAYVLRKKMNASQINNLVLELNKKIMLLACSPSLINISAQKQPPDFEDALLYEIALHHQMDYFITSNLKDFNKIKSVQLPVLRAKEFNKLLS